MYVHNVKELKEKLAALPDDMELVGESASGQEEISGVEVCHWIHDGMYYTEEEKGRLGLSQAQRIERPQLRITIKY